VRVMTLRQWRGGLGYREAAKKLGLATMTYLRFEKGSREPYLSVARRIRKLTRGAVTENDLAAIRRRFLANAPHPT
jgi:DNA-binding XRE family transcriptional regulator